MGGLAKTTLQLGALFGFCHIFDTYNKQKQLLKLFPFPMNITALQFAVGTVVALVMWTTGILRRPKLSGAQLAAMLPMAMVHTLVNLFFNIGPGKVAVSFTHITNKAPPMEHFHSVLLLCMIFLAQFLAAWFVVSLAPTVTLQTSNVSRKKVMVKTKEPLDSINLLSIITVMSFMLMVPLTFLTEDAKFTPRFLRLAGFDLEQMYSISLVAALCFHAYQQGLYMILSQLTIMRPIAS